MKILQIALTISSCLFVAGELQAFSPEPDSVAVADRLFTDRDGIVSLEAEHWSSNRGWRERDYYTGIGLTWDAKANGQNDARATFNLEIKKEGSYNLFILGNKKPNTAWEDNLIRISIIDHQGTIGTQLLCGFADLNAPAWSSFNVDSPSSECRVIILCKGRYTLEVKPFKGSGFFLDKIVLSLDPDFMPSGTGPEETSVEGSHVGFRNQVILPPHWAFGVLYGGYTNHKQSIELLDSLIYGGFPVDAFWIDSYFWDFNKGKGPRGYIDFIGDTNAFPDLQELWDNLEDRKIKAGIWVWDLILQQGNEPVFNEFLDRGFFSRTYLNTNGWHNETRNTLTGEIDFSNPQATAYWKEKMRPFFDKGLDFLKLDNSSSIPFCEAAFSTTREFGGESLGRGFILAHLHTIYDYRHKLYPTRWTGDAKISWSQPDYPNLRDYAMGGLKENIAMVSDPRRSTYEVPFLSHDAGGYNYFGSIEQDEELYMRWIQFASMNTIMMFFSTSSNPTRNHPYRYSKAVQDNFRKYTHLRMRLFPYIYTYALNTHLTGEKIIAGTHDYNYQYLFGKEMLVAPVYEKGKIERKILLPPGEWIDLENDRVYSGGREIHFEAPVTKLPILVRKGAIIPMREYARAIELGNNDTLSLEVYPSDRLTSFELLEDDGLSNQYLHGKYARTLLSVQKRNRQLCFEISSVSGDFEGMGTERYYMIRIHLSPRPEKVKFSRGGEDGKWTYLEDDEIVEIHLNTLKTVGRRIKVKY